MPLNRFNYCSCCKSAKAFWVTVTEAYLCHRCHDKWLSCRLRTTEHEALSAPDRVMGGDTSSYDLTKQ